jgi:iron complex transport system substrate-binding protein
LVRSLESNIVRSLPKTPRAVSLLPSTTEIACALGFRDALVGRSHECDYPADVVSLPILTEPKLDADAPSRAIDDRVKQLVRDGLSVYRVDAEKLRELAPELILTQAQCEVCAASLADVDEAIRDWTGTRPAIVSLVPRTLGDVWGDFTRVASAFGEPDRGRALASRLSDRITELSERAESASPQRPRVACIEWIDPLMSAGNWVPELLSLARAEPLFGAPGEHSPWLEWNDLVAADPDTILVMPCGFDIARSRAELGPLVNRDGFADLRAAREGQVYLVDGNAYFNRPGPRLAESLEILCEVLHPESFGQARRGRGWEPL